MTQKEKKAAERRYKADQRRREKLGRKVYGGMAITGVVCLILFVIGLGISSWGLVGCSALVLVVLAGIAGAPVAMPWDTDEDFAASIEMAHKLGI